MTEKIEYKKLSDAERRIALCDLAVNFLTIKTCQKCGYPTVDGYGCHFCGDYNPNLSYEEERKRKE